LEQACAEGRAEANQRQVPFLVAAHAPPSFTSLSGMEAVSADWNYHAVEFQPDYCVSGHIHFAPFLAEDGWYHHQGRTWAFNPGCDENALYEPSRIILDTAGREARFFSSRKMARIDLDPRSGRIN
jgi:Icc-related predicted phosphoesterase